jgi:hypothetical protein
MCPQDGKRDSRGTGGLVACNGASKVTAVGPVMTLDDLQGLVG